MLTKRASAAIEYMAMLTFILAAFFIFQHYIVRGFSGRWKSVGDTFGHGKQYDPRDFGDEGEGGGTYECFFDHTHCDPDRLPPDCVADPACDPRSCPNQEDRIYRWVDKRCYDFYCDCSLPPEVAEYIGTGEPIPSGCLECVKACAVRGEEICSD